MNQLTRFLKWSSFPHVVHLAEKHTLRLLYGSENRATQPRPQISDVIFEMRLVTNGFLSKTLVCKSVNHQPCFKLTIALERYNLLHLHQRHTERSPVATTECFNHVLRSLCFALAYSLFSANVSGLSEDVNCSHSSPALSFTLPACHAQSSMSDAEHTVS